MRVILLLLFLIAQSAYASDCRPDRKHYHLYGTGYLGFMETEEMEMDTENESLLIWWKDDGVPEGCYEEKCTKKYFGYSILPKSTMFKKVRSILRKRKPDVYLLVWKDRIQFANDKRNISVLKMNLAMSDWSHSNNIGAEYPLTNKEGYYILPENVLELGCGINLLNN